MHHASIIRIARRALPLTALALILLASTSQVGAAKTVPCMDQFRFAGSRGCSQYYVSNVAMTWTEANALCQSVPGGHLATIEDAEENSLVAGCDLDGTNTGLWIGLTDEGHEAVWTWVTGEPFTYSNWDGGQPDRGTAENVVSMKPSHMPYSAGMWHDQDTNSVVLPCVLEVVDCPSPAAPTSWGQLKQRYR